MREEWASPGRTLRRFVTSFISGIADRGIRLGILPVQTWKTRPSIFALLKPEENVGVRLTSGFLLEPGQSTSAIVVHHPGAKYFVV